MEDNKTDLLQLGISDRANLYLKEAARWARFLAIFGFVIMAVVVLAGIGLTTYFSALMASEFGAMGGAILPVIYILFSLLYFFPCLYLFRFASKTRAAVLSSDAALLEAGLKNLKAFFRYMGILLIVVLAFYALAFVIALIAASFAH